MKPKSRFTQKMINNKKDLQPLFLFFQVLIFLLLSLNNSKAQACFCTNCPLQVPDNGTITSTINVSGAINNSLTTNNLCKVCVKFKHELVGDLIIKIQSPSGQVLSLTGPVSQNGLTSFSTWDVCFIPCTQVAAPYSNGTFGATAKWSNDQAWGSFGNYTGTYYPYGGCFSDLNTGTVNGNWKLVATDADAIHVGEILDWSLEFCNPTGIGCLQCNANAGTIPTSPIIACSGTSALAFNVVPTWTPATNQPSAAQFSYQYVITKNDIIVGYQAQPDLKTYAAGTYNVCGMSYKTSDAGLIPTPNNILTLSDLKTQLSSATPPFCAKFTTNCISVVIKKTPAPTNLVQTICNNQSVKIGTQTFKTSGNYSVKLSSSNGCDSIVNLNLTVKPTVSKILNVAICQGSSFKIGNKIYKKQGAYKDTLVAKNGCDSVVFLSLAITPAAYIKFSKSICQGDSVIFGTKFFKKSGIYQDTFKNFSLCDTAYQMTLNVLKPSIKNIDTSSCSSFQFGTLKYTKSGTYIEKLKNKVGCDSTINLKLVIKNTSSDTLKITKCFGQSYNFLGTNLINTGVYNKTLVAKNGCDSFLVLKLTILKQIQSKQNFAVCSGIFVLVGKRFYSKTGTYKDTLLSQNGCDSILTTTLTVSDTIKQNLVKTICQGSTYKLGNQVLTANGKYKQSFKTKSGCDSIVSLNLTVLANIKTINDTTVCFGEKIKIGNKIHQISGAYIDTLKAATGCDSIIFTQLNVRLEKKKDLFLTICEGDKILVAQNNYTKSGTYLDLKSPTASGCDSVTNLYLTVSPKYSKTIKTKLCFGQSYKLNNKLFSKKGIFIEKMLSKNNCDSTITLDLDFYPEAKYEINTGICKGESFIFNGKFYDKKGTYFDTLKTITNCDSIVKIILVSNPDKMTSFKRTICEGDSIEVGFSVYTKAGIYKDTLFSNPGCDSIVTLTLKVEKPKIENLKKTICFGEKVIYNNTNYSKSGNYKIKIINPNTCDSTLNLDLIVKDSIGTNRKDTLCSGQSIVINGGVYNKAGDYYFKNKAKNGCDSTYLVSITISNCSFNIDYKTKQPKCAGEANASIIFSVPKLPILTYTCSLKRETTDVFKNKIYNAGDKDSLTNLVAGTYYFYINVKNQNKIDTIIIADKSALALIFSPSIFGKYNLACGNKNNGTLNTFVNGGTPPYRYVWNTKDTTSNIKNLAADTYRVTVSDANNCKNILSNTLTAPLPLSTSFVLEKPTCKQPNKGSLTIKETKNGQKPYLYNLDNQGFGSLLSFNSLKSGKHILSIKDTFGCVLDTTFTLEDPKVITVSLGQDTTILKGDTILISANLNLPISALDTLIWSTNFKPNCPKCLFGKVSSMTNTSYFVKVIGKDGCEATAYKIVRIDDRIPVYVPNSFSPNNDGINDYFNLFGDDTVLKINVLSIFDRWGNQVYEGTNLEPNNTLQGWDGAYKGKDMNSDVFAFSAIILLKNNQTRKIDGEVMLIK